MFKLPKLSAPLTKAIRTTEGILVVVVNVLLAVGSQIPQTHLTTKEAGLLVVINTGLLTLQRGLIKATALLKGYGTPLEPAVFGSAMAFAPVSAEALGDIAKVAADAVAAAASQPAGPATPGS